MDTLSPKRRSQLMARVKAKNTAPELIVRRLAHRMGYRFRVHRRDIPGTPDIAFIARRKVINVHGCFWHGHNCALGQRLPKTRPEFWKAKFETNRKRDARVSGELVDAGWKQLVIWECQLADIDSLADEVWRFLNA